MSQQGAKGLSAAAVFMGSLVAFQDPAVSKGYSILHSQPCVVAGAPLVQPRSGCTSVMVDLCRYKGNFQICQGYLGLDGAGTSAPESLSYV